MRKIILTGLLLFPVITAIAPTSSAQATLRLKDISGRQLNLASHKGKVLLVNFWATWCIPCRTEIPYLIKMQRQYRDQGLRIIGVTYPPERLSEVQRFVRRLRMNYPIAVGTKASKAYFTASDTLPMTVVIDGKGKVHDVIEGIMYPDEFDQKVKPLLSVRTIRRTEKLQRVESKRAVQNETILVEAQGYRPSSVNLRRGIPARLTFVRRTDQTCGRDIVIPDYRIRESLPLNTPVVVTLTPNKSGRFKFTCGMNMFKGALLVR